MQNANYSLRIGWLYPDLMSTYGDRGNIICLTKRCEWRGISTEIIPITSSTNDERLKTIDLLFGGGAQDREQALVMRDLKGKKGEIIKEKIEANIPALFVCGAPQLMGKYYEPAVGEKIEGLGIFDMETINPGIDKPRCIGNIVADVQWNNIHLTNDQRLASIRRSGPMTKDYIVGFENHGGRTYLGKSALPFAKVIKGFGNNGEDGTEGVIFKNAIGCYFHGPLLPKNPHITDFLIQRALLIKYDVAIPLSPLDDTLERQAQQVIAKRLGVAL